MEKTLRFDMIEAGTEFRFDGRADQTPAVKLSTRTAAVGGYADQKFNVKPSTMVTITVPDPTPEELAQRKIERFVWKLWNEQRDAQDTIGKFAARLANDPAYAFEWGDAAAEAAARLRVVRTMANIAAGATDADGQLSTDADGPILPGVTVEGIDKALAWAKEQAMRSARYPSRSTSVMSNVMHVNMGAAWAEYADRG